MPYTVGQSGVANYANTTLTTVTRVVANGGVGGSNESAVGGSSRVALSYTIAANATNLSISVDSLSGYVAGNTDITVIVDANVYVWSPTQGSSALLIQRASTGDTVKLVNNGYIAGWGGNGGGVSDVIPVECCANYEATTYIPTAGTLAFEYSTLSAAPLTIENNGYIGGGGGGGGCAINDYSGSGAFALGGASGGGGAGGGISYNFTNNRARATPTSPTGLNGNTFQAGYDCDSVTWYTGGGGGFTFPGVGGALPEAYNSYRFVGVGGGAGGSGALMVGDIGPSFLPSNSGGSGGDIAGNTQNTSGFLIFIAGGGGGWGAVGARGYVDVDVYQTRANGGPAIKRNGNTVTISTGLSRIYGTTVI
jgi:hypothetical protein